MTPYAWSGLLAGVSSFCFGLLVLLKAPKRDIGLIWFLFSLSVAGYGFGAIWMGTAKIAAQGLLAYKVSYALGVLWIPVLFYHFISIFLGIRQRRSIVAHYLIAIVFLVTLPSSLFYSGVRWVFHSMFYPIVGPAQLISLPWWMGLVFYSHYLLIREYNKVSPEKKNQIKYFFVATAIGFSGGGLSYLPFYRIDVYPWGNFTVCLYPFIMSYAIVKHHLMDINVIIRKTIVSAMGLLFAIASYIVFVAHFTHHAMLPVSNISIFTAVFSAAMSIFVLLRSQPKKPNIMWSLACMSIAIWSLGYGMMMRSATLPQAFFWLNWFVYPGSLMIPLLFLHFVSLLVKRDTLSVIRIGYVIAIALQVLQLAGRVSNLEPKPPFNFYPTAIFPLYPSYFLYFAILATYAEWLLFKELRTAEEPLKTQIKYVFLGTSIGFCGGLTTFLLGFNIHFFPVGVYVIPIYLLTITYAIYKHHLLDINIALRKSLVYSLMTGVLTAIYLVMLTQGAHILQELFGASTMSISILAACLISAIFLPLRTRVQAFVDRYFFRDWADRPLAREMASGFSHELKSPLAGLSMQAQLALMELEDFEKQHPSLKRDLTKLKDEMHYIVNQAMDAARRIEAVRGMAEPTRGQMEPVRVTDLMDNSLSSLQSLLGQIKVSIHRDLPEQIAPICGDAKQLEIVFLNLMKNAVQAMDGRNGGGENRLSLTGQEQDSSVFISVKDTGPGIAARDVGRIFEPYFTTKGHKGTGMGLYLSQQIVKAHGGSIEVRSEEGKGTEFIVRLPKHPTSGKKNEAA